MKRLGAVWLWAASLSLLMASVSAQGAPRVAVLELHNSTDERLARFDSASEGILAAALRDSGCCQVLDRGLVSSRLLAQPIRLHEIYDQADRAAALGQALQVDYVVTGRALDYRQDGRRHQMEVELVVVDVRRSAYVVRQRLEAETQGDADRKQHRPLLDQLAARALPAIIEAMDLRLIPDSDLGVHVAESTPPQSSSPQSSILPSAPPSTSTPPAHSAPDSKKQASPPAIYGAPVGALPRQVHRVSQEAEWRASLEPPSDLPLAAMVSQLNGQPLEELSDEDLKQALERLGIRAKPSQGPEDPLDRAWQGIHKGRFASARPWLQQALKDALQSGDRRREAHARDGLCEIDRRQAAPQMLAPALAHGWLAVDLHLELGQAMELSAALRRVAGIEAATGHGARALENLRTAWTRAEAQNDVDWDEERAEIRLAMADAHLAVGDPESARRQLLTVLESWRQGNRRIRQAQLLMQLAQLDASFGRIGDADGHLLQVLDLYDVDTADFDLEALFEDIESQVRGGKLQLLGMGMSQLAAVYAAAFNDETRSDPKPSWDPAHDALLDDAYRQVLATTAADPEVFSRNNAMLQAQIATVVQPAGFDAGQIPIAEAPQEVLCAFFERSKVLERRARLYEQVGRTEAADTLRQQAWDAWLNTSGRYYAILMRNMLPAQTVVPLPGMGSVQAEQARKAGSYPPFPFLPPICGPPDFHRNELWRAETYAASGQVEIARSVYKGFAMAAPHARVEALMGSAKLEKQLGNPDVAVDFYRDALDWSDALLDSLHVEPSAYAARLAKAYDALIGLLIERGDLDAAFRTTERARAYTLHRQMAGQIPLLPGASEVDLRTYQTLGIKLQRLQSREIERVGFFRSKGRQPPDDAATRDRLQQARREWQVLQQKLYGPDGAVLLGRRTVNLDTARRKIVPEATSLLVYFTLPDTTLAWVVDRDNVYLERLPIGREQLDEEVTLLLDALALEQPYEDPARRLFDALVRPLLPHLRHQDVTVVPHGILHYLPMAALWNARQDRFLLDDIRLTMAPSVTALQHLQRRPDVAGHALVMGNPDHSLDFAEQEALDVAGRLGVEAQLHLDASKARFLEQAGDADIIHLAAHGTLDTFNPMQSHLQLAPDDASGRLTAAEIFGLDLEATDLVVLSACQTGLGELTRGDDIVGLNRAFLVAGASSVLTTLWQVEDASTARLMGHFYERLQTSDGGPAEALRQAQQAVRSDPRWRHPYFWAGFRLSGDGGAPP